MALDDNCCGCMQLETGGYIIGWLFIVSCVLGILGALGNIASPTGCEGNDCTIPIAGSAVSLILTIIVLIIAIFLIKGMNSRDAKKVFPMYIVLIIEIVFIALGIIGGFLGGVHWAGLIPLLIGLLIVAYCFIIIRAIYRKFQNESHPAGVGA
ncbi:hypothetical protein PVAND_007671 [Polypedilum vanderplanki]|uniref:Uncharacterized protein n=1 Tax=Polypedilum vanderplanki TaxID=319348 RepID=A0A9J6C8I4_POLVA|nr:hypothetical protein PVAND_007671 [Polypedilum vanderplanki]